MRLALPIEAVDRTVDGAVEIVGVDEGAIGEVMAFEVAPGMSSSNLWSSAPCSSARCAVADP
jgi:hypothetical protein